MKTRIAMLFFLITGILFLALFMFTKGRVIELARERAGFIIPSGTLSVPEAPQPPIASATVPPPAPARIADIEPQPQLSNPPEVIKAIYATNWSAGSERKISALISLIRDTELNAIVIDIKDYSGYVGYNTELALPKQYRAVELRIPRLNTLIKRLHDEGIYVIGRISVFQDQRLALARPELALQSSSTKSVWKDHKGLSWMDTASRDVWDYNIAIAREILTRGFDEVNFDYIRFASDGALSDIIFPVWDSTTLKTHVVRNFFKYMREKLPNATISADLFGLVTVNTDGLGIGQQLEYAFPYFDAIAPMVYPSHYYKGFIGYQNPAAFPYEVVHYSMERAVARLVAYRKAQIEKSNTASSSEQFAIGDLPVRQAGLRFATLRPWLQDFDLGADYDAENIRAQIRGFD